MATGTVAAPDAVAERDYFSDPAVLLDPYDYFEEVRAHGPVHQLKTRDILVVTGFKESVDVLLNTQDFSSVISTGGPTIPLPFEPRGDDIAAQIEEHRDEIATTALLVTYDGKHHAAVRSLLTRLFTPSRLRANEEYMWAYADRVVREAVATGGCEVINDIAVPYVTLVIADLLGVPEDDRRKFEEVIAQGRPAGDIEAAGTPQVSQTLIFLGGYFAQYIQDRREHPRDDVMTELALDTYPDGTTPDLMEVVKAAMFLFAAGQDTSAKLIGNAMRFLVEDPELQQALRDDRSLIPPFLEEVLRLEGSTKVTFRLAKRKTMVGDVEVPAGKRLVVGLAAANRDPRRWADPKTLRIGREKIKEHVAFGRGAHVCIGAPLARAEVRVIIDRFLEHTSSIGLSETHHGATGARTLDYEPSYIIRGLVDLNVTLTA